jgi:peptide/nickel transport system substrate-binding protein
MAMRSTLLFLFFLQSLSAAYQEAPMLSERTIRGGLPPVEQRLPDNPLVVQPVERIGTYGGTWRRLAVNTFDIALNDRLGYESLVVWQRNGKDIAPGLAERWDILDEGKTYRFHLRRGLKWSDGVPFTSEDLMYFYEGELLNLEITPVFPSWLVLENQQAILSAPDPHTIEFHFAKPYGIFLGRLAYLGSSILAPKHYLSQFHPAFAKPADLKKRLADSGMNLWFQLYGRLRNLNENPDLPTLCPFQVKAPPPASRVVAERNPFYWKVDPAGNQLPYIDRIAYTMVQNREIGNFKAMTGAVDFQARFIDSANYTLFMENHEKGGYRVLKDDDPLTTVIYLNQSSKDPVKRKVLQDRRFRIALSTAINREELADLIYSGLAKPARGVVSPYDPYYRAEYDQMYMEYDPARANRLLDEAGLARDASGLRHWPDGRPFREILDCFPSEVGTGSDQWQLVADYWREVGLDFTIKLDTAALSLLKVRNGNTDFWAYATIGIHWTIDPLWYVPFSESSYFAPLFGRYQETFGRSGEKPPPEFQQLADWYDELRSTVNDEGRKGVLAHKILDQWAEECYTIGIVRQQQLTIVSNHFHNCPEHIIHDYRLKTPGYLGIEQFFMEGE